ncbi:hypothetical protein, partial [Escherichia coli]|uniref:hypothetical protein n=1 Tax=Escherichia coli TaxID=562 RepID=UPI0021C89189
KFIMLPSETMIWQPEFTDKTLSRKTGAVQSKKYYCSGLYRILLSATKKVMLVSQVTQSMEAG